MKKILFSHISDVDGVGCAVLAKLIFSDIEVKLIRFEEAEMTLMNFLKGKDALNYDKIYISDFRINDDVIMEIDNSLFKDKVTYIDHHLTDIDMSKYKWATVMSEKNNIPVSAASLIYDYLVTNYPNEKVLIKENVKTFVDLIRRRDTWDWDDKETRDNANNLSKLLDIYGQEKFINTFVDRIANEDVFSFSDIEKEILAIEEKRLSNYIDEKEKTMLFYNYENYCVGVAFAELYRSELGNELALRHADEVDFIVIINVSGSISYRCTKEINLNEISSAFGGGGHKKAAGSPLPDKFLEKIVLSVFGPCFKRKD